jgi:prephenate dehydrogenase
MPKKLEIKTVGLLGFGAFGRLITEHLHPHVRLLINDPAAESRDPDLPRNAAFAGLDAIGGCDLVILAVPVSAMVEAIRDLHPHLKPGTIVADVGSVKMTPATIMQAELPEHVEIVGTHPLFGPQSARGGIRGRKIAVCPIRGKSAFRVAAFLKQALGLRVFLSTPENHDRDAAVVQGLTHLIARILVRMEPLPRDLTTASFDLLMEATGMVRNDPETVYRAIEQANPFAATTRDRFFEIAAQVRSEVDGPAADTLRRYAG